MAVWLRLRSDQDLVERLVKLGASAVMPLTGLATLSGAGSAIAPYQLPVSPPAMLLAAGRATAAIGPTPMARFNTVGWWAVQRWYWTLMVSASGAIDPDGTSSEIRHHHRAAFTEALGLAASLLIAEHVLAGGTPAVALGPAAAGTAPIVIDVESLVGGPGTRPDLLVLDGLPTATSTPRAILIESKGRSDPGALFGAMRSGLSQLTGISGGAVRMAAGASVPRGGILEAYAVQLPATFGPPSSPVGSSAVPVSGPPAGGGTGTVSVTPPVPAGPVSIDGLALDEFAAERIERLNSDRLSAFLSLDDVVPRTREQRPVAAGVSVEIEGVTFSARDEFGVADVTVGLLAEVADDVRRRRAAGAGSEREPEVRRSHIRDLRTALPEDDPSASARGAIADDGCVIAVNRR